jgi:hypothetical protein
MGIEDYYKQFIDKIRNEACLEGSDPESFFIEHVLTNLEEMGELYDPIPMSVKIKNRRRQILGFDAYSYDEADGALVLICSEFTNQRELSPILTNTRIEELVSQMQRFIEEAVDGDVSQLCDDDNPVTHIANEFRKKIGNNLTGTDILRFKFLIISNCALSKQVKTLKCPDLLGRPVELKVWSLDNIYNNYIANSNEVVEFYTADFGYNSIQCMKAEIGDKSNDSYLCVVPGLLLASLYLKYRNNLLQKHVRGVLKSFGKVNISIRNSIIHRPETFFELNNGVAAVAREVKLDTNNNIVAFKDFQILNGCQTVIALANAILKNETGNKLAGLYVPMKLIVFNLGNDSSIEELDLYDFDSLKISECTQSQLPARDTDFSSNHPFHILMEQLSRKVIAPSVEGNPYQTKWFYERHRNGWYQEQITMNLHQIKNFLNIYPKQQVLSKEKFAKCYNTILMHPEQVCKGTSSNLKCFALFIEKIYNNREKINEDFYKKCICSVIIYDSLGDIISQAPWYHKGGYKAQIIPYTIAKLISLIPPDKDINWNLIWKKQKLYHEIEDELAKLAYDTYVFLTQKASRSLISTVSRLTSTWSDYRNVSYKFSEQFLRTLIDKSQNN